MYGLKIVHQDKVTVKHLKKFRKKRYKLKEYSPVSLKSGLIK